jgi:hypothetical protein
MKPAKTKITVSEAAFESYIASRSLHPPAEAEQWT